MTRLVGIGALLFLLSGMGAASAQEACDDIAEVDRFGFLRQLTLDLYLRPPTLQEYETLHVQTEITEEQIRDMTQSEEFHHFLRRHHADLLWPNVNQFSLVSPAIALLFPAGAYEMGGDPDRLFLYYVGYNIRGGFVPCKDEPAEFDENGDVILEPWPDGTMRDGYVLVDEPYWAPGTQVKVCALEARIHPMGTNGLPCNSPYGLASGDCGCGPSLQHCASIDSSAQILAALQEQFARMIRTPIEKGQSYFEMLLARNEPLNGALIHYYRYLVGMALDPVVQVPPVPVSTLPVDVPFNDETWTDYERSPEHSGILTSLPYLLRFQTDRARAARFYNAFLCAPFQAPGIDLPSPSDPCSEEPDLRERCGCATCHQTLEPASAYWGRFAEAGSLFLDPEVYPEFRQLCATCAQNPLVECSADCLRFYFTEAGHPKEEPYLGMLNSYVFRDEEELARQEAGPEGIVLDNLGTDALDGCVVRQLYTRLYGREMTITEAIEVLPGFIERFRSSGYDFRDLVVALVTDPAYRRTAR